MIVPSEISASPRPGVRPAASRASQPTVSKLGAIAMMPALAMAAPATTKPAGAATQTVKAESVALIKHHKTRLVHKVRMERHPKAKTATTKS